MTSVSPARRAAFSILKTLEKDGHSDTLLRGGNVDALSEPDRKLTTALVLGVLRWQISLDQQVRPFLKHPNAKLDSDALIALRLGAFQLLHMDRIPARAAVDESVGLTKQAGHRFASGMVNAVLRKLAASRPEYDASTMADSCQGHPAWMVERWTDFYGAEAARAICRHGQHQANLSVRLNGAEAEAELVSAGVSLQPGAFLSAARQVVAGDVASVTAIREGHVRIQDEGSQLIAELVPRGRSILDCCAAPGGKTLILAERDPEAQISACDGSHQRLAQLKKRLAILGERVQCRLADATKLEHDSAFDVALADVPCSGTGTLGRNPEIRHRLRLEDLPRHHARQTAILGAALRAVRPGGYVLYSTCSIEPEENEQVVAAVLAGRTDARLVPLQTRIEELRAEEVLVDPGAMRLLESLSSEGFLRLLPGLQGTDGFFAALIQRKG